jgi:hypothetical protein
MMTMRIAEPLMMDGDEEMGDGSLVSLLWGGGIK